MSDSGTDTRATETPTPMLSSLAEDIEGYIRATPKAAEAIAVDYWHLVNWQQEATRLQAELVALRAVVAAAEAYHAACVATEEAYDGGAPGWGDRVSDAFVPRNEASDALRTAIAARQHAAPAPTREERP